MNVPAGTVPPEVRRKPGITAVDDRRGTGGMILTIATEASLFIVLFFSYFYLAKGGWRWLAEEPPKLTLALILLAILLASSVVLWWGEQQAKRDRPGAARLAVGITLALGIAFLVVQSFEYKDRLNTLTPQTNVYGSIFYTITGFHGAHVIVGLLMLFYLLALPRLEPVNRPPHRPLHNVALYWHFVDFVWIWIVAFLYVAPNIR